MSIYPVRLSEWFPPGDEMFEITYLLSHKQRCYACGKKTRYKAAVGHHSLPWGYGDLYCSWKCVNSGKVAKEDKRRQRRLNRKFKKLDRFWTKLKEKTQNEVSNS